MKSWIFLSAGLAVCLAVPAEARGVKFRGFSASSATAAAPSVARPTVVVLPGMRSSTAEAKPAPEGGNRQVIPVHSKSESSSMASVNTSDDDDDDDDDDETPEIGARSPAPTAATPTSGSAGAAASASVAHAEKSKPLSAAPAIKTHAVPVMGVRDTGARKAIPGFESVE